MGRNDKPTRDAVGGFRTKIAAHDMEAEIDASRTAGRRQDLAFVHIEYIRVEVDFWMTGSNRIGVTPMRRGPASVEQAGGGEDRYAGAERHQPGPSAVGGAQGLK